MTLASNLPLILAAALVTSAGPGAATLAIAETSMQSGRRSGLAVSLGVATGSLLWSIAAAFGLAAAMAASVWAVDVLRYFGAAYLMLLAFRSARAAMHDAGDTASETRGDPSPARAYAKGLALHLTNPKPILFFGSLYTLSISPETSAAELAVLIAAVGVQSVAIFTGYAWLFSNARVARAYMRLRRGFEAAFAVIFVGASVKMLAFRL